jgi:hypothetical protein
MNTESTVEQEHSALVSSAEPGKPQATGSQKSGVAKGMLRAVWTLPLALVLYAMALTVLDSALKWHWIAGIFAILLYSVALILGLSDLRSKEAKEFPLIKGLSIFLLLVLVGAAVFGTLSLLLETVDWAQYTTEGYMDLIAFNSYYLWLFADMLPVLKVTETLDLAAPIAPVGVVAGLPVLAFRAFVMYGLLKAIKAWWSERKTVDSNVAPAQDAK